MFFSYSSMGESSTGREVLLSSLACLFLTLASIFCISSLFLISWDLASRSSAFFCFFLSIAWSRQQSVELKIHSFQSLQNISILRVRIS